MGWAAREHHPVAAVTQVKAIGLELKISTRSRRSITRRIFAKPIDAELVLDIDLLTLNPKSANDLENLYLLTRESMLKSGLYAYHDHLQATNKFYLPRWC